MIRIPGIILVVLLLVPAFAQTAPESVTASLNSVQKLSAEDAVKQAGVYREQRDKASGEPKRVAYLLYAVALERSGNFNAAAEAYRALIKDAAGTPYAASASYRLRMVENPKASQEEIEKIHENISKESKDEQGWYQVGNQWEWTTSHQAAWKNLSELRANNLSFRLFDYLRSKSIFPREYSFLFVLLALGIGAKILAFPLHVKSSKLLLQIRKLRPEIRQIQQIYAGDAVAMNQELMQLYKDRGINMWGGCAVLLLDMIFVIAALIGLSDFAPRMAMDGSRFLWIPDVLKPNLSLLAVWIVISFFQTLITARFQPTGNIKQLGCGALISGAIFMAVAWYWAWPSYVIIFWIMLSLMGMMLNLMLMGFHSASD